MQRLKKILQIGGIAVLGIKSYKYVKKSEKLEIKYNHERLKPIIDMNPSFSKIYYPSFWILSGHLQTIWVLMMNKIDKKIFKFTNHKFSQTRKSLQTSDKEKIYLDFFVKSRKFDSKVNEFENYDFLEENYNNSNILVIVPGACGSSGEFYLTDVMERFINDNFKCVVINHRGVLNYPLQSNLLYHAGWTNDVKETFEFLNSRVKGSKYFLLGFSMGGNIVTKFLGETGEYSKSKFNIYGGCSVCGPLNLDKFTSFTEEESRNYFYSKFFCKNLKGLFFKNKEALTRICTTEEDKKTFENKVNESFLSSHFYSNYVYRAFKFEGKEDYMNKNSGENYISNIQVPFLCIFSKDDPIIPYDCLEEKGDYLKNDKFMLVYTASGGHVGFFKGLYFKRWIHEPISQFLKDLSFMEKFNI